jgi:hypothetical protein
MAKTIGQLTELAATPDATDIVPIEDSGVTKKISVTNLTAATLGLAGTKTVAEAVNLALGTTTGTKIGTATNQLLGFWNATPVDQPALTADLLDSLQEVGLIASGAGNTPLDLTSGALTCGALTAGAATATSLASTGAVTSSSPTAGIGYATGAGGTVTQGTNRTTAVTIDKICGSITLFSAAGSTSWQSFTVNNSTVAIGDSVIVCQRSGTDLYELHVTAVAAGSFRISFRTTAGTTTEQPVINFAVIKAVAA